MYYQAQIIDPKLIKIKKGIAICEVNDGWLLNNVVQFLELYIENIVQLLKQYSFIMVSAGILLPLQS